MIADPKNQQNPPYDEGDRPAEQAAPRVKVPDEKTARRDAPSNSADPAHLENYPAGQGANASGKAAGPNRRIRS